MTPSNDAGPPRRRFPRIWGPDVDAEVDEELRFHLEMRARDFAARGATPEQAERAARERFGSVERVSAALRDHDRRQARHHQRREIMDELRRDVTFGLRSIRRAPLFALLAVLTLALGIGATTAIFSVVYSALLRPLPYPAADRLVDLTESREGNRGTVSPSNYADLHAQSRTVGPMMAWHNTSAALTGGARAEQAQGAMVTGEFLDVLGVRPALGRAFSAAEAAPAGPKAVLLGHGLWLRRFGGDPGIVGRTIQLDGRAHEVVGVMPRGFAFPATAELWLPLAFTADELAAQRGAHYLRVVGRLRDGTTVETAQAELAAIAGRLAAQHPDQNEGMTAAVRPLRDALVGDVRAALYLLLGAVLLLLLLACANVANLLLARAVRRERERVIRVALGAGRGRLARELLTECLLLGLAGGAAGLLLAIAGTRALTATLQVSRPSLAAAQIDVPVLLFALGASLVTGLVFGLLPALTTSRVAQIATVLRGTAPAAGGWRNGGRMRGALVAGQVAATVLLLTGAALLAQSFARLRQVELGFEPRGVWTFSVALPAARYPEPAQAEAFVATLLERVRALPGVERAGATMALPLSGTSYRISLHSLDGVELGARSATPAPQLRVTTEDYFGTMGMPLRRGRAFLPTDRRDAAPVVVVDEALAHALWPGEDPIGRRLVLGTRMGFDGDRVGGTVVGVVADVRGLDVREEPTPTVYLPHRQAPIEAMSIAVRAADPPALRRPVAAIMAALDPEVPVYEERTLQAIVSDAVAEPRLYTVLLLAFAGTALALAAVGVYGVVALTVGQRTHEIGIRMALGARAPDVLRMIVRQSTTPLAAGLALGVVASWWASRALAGLLYGVRATDPATFAAVVAFLALVTLVATVIPARRATRVPPTQALRSE